MEATFPLFAESSASRDALYHAQVTNVDKTKQKAPSWLFWIRRGMNPVFLFLVLFFILGAWPMYLHVTVLALSFFILIVAAQRHCQGRQFYAHRIHLTTYARDTVLSDTLSILSYFTLAMHFVCSQVHMWSWCGAAAPTSIVPSSSAYKSTEHYHCYICLWHFWKVCLALETYRACPKICSLTSLCWSVCLPGHTGTTCISCRQDRKSVV